MHQRSLSYQFILTSATSVLPCFEFSISRTDIPLRLLNLVYVFVVNKILARYFPLPFFPLSLSVSRLLPSLPPSILPLAVPSPAHILPSSHKTHKIADSSFQDLQAESSVGTVTDKDMLPVLIRGSDNSRPESTRRLLLAEPTPFLYVHTCHHKTMLVCHCSSVSWPCLWFLPVSVLAMGLRDLSDWGQPHNTTDEVSMAFTAGPLLGLTPQESLGQSQA